jgi:hypothetical protein
MGNRTKQNFLKRRNSNGQKSHEKMLTIPGHKGNANQNHTKIPPHPTGVGEDVGKKKPLYTAGRNASSATTLEN